MVVRLAAIVAMCVLSTMANAQVFRCTDPVSKKTTYSDAPCIDGKEVVRKRSAEEILLDEQRADLARQRRQLEQDRQMLREQQANAPAQAAPVESTGGMTPECEIALKNAWGANRAEKQRKADIICYGPERAAQIEAERQANRKIRTTCVHQGMVSNCVSR